MDVDKKQNKGNDGRPTIDLENIFLRLLVIGPPRQMELEPLFAYELCSGPPSLIGEQGCLCKGNKSGLMKKSPKIQALPPTSSNLLLHVLRAHLQVMLWKAADQQAPPDVNMAISLGSDGRSWTVFLFLCLLMVTW